MNLRTKAVLGLLLAATVSAPALALSPQEEAAYRQHCTNDYMRLCSQYDPDSPQVQQCFRARMKELSPGCQSTIAQYNRRGR